MNLSLPSKGAGSRLRGGGLRHAEEGLPGVFCVLPPSSCFGEAERLGPSRPRTLWHVSCGVGRVPPCDCPLGFCCWCQRD